MLCPKCRHDNYYALINWEDTEPTWCNIDQLIDEYMQDWFKVNQRKDWNQRPNELIGLTTIKYRVDCTTQLALYQHIIGTTTL